MNWVKLLLIVLCLVLFRIATKALLGDFFYSAVGNMLGLAIPLIASILISRVFGNNREYQFHLVEHLPRSLIGTGILVVFLIFIASSLLGGVEELMRTGSIEFQAKIFVFGWSKEMKENFLSVLFVAPILEELFFNGTLLPGLARRYTPLAAVFIVSFIFLSFHMSSAELRNGHIVITDKVALLLMSTFNSIVVLISSDIRLAILFHFTWNFLSYLFPVIVGISGIDFSIPSVLVGFSLILVPLCIYLIAQRFKYVLKKLLT